MPGDLRKAIIKGRKEAAKTIVRSLIEKGPWWTGTFGENWIVSKNPVQPTRKRKQQVPYFVIPFREPRAVKNARVPNVTLKQNGKNQNAKKTKSKKRKSKTRIQEKRKAKNKKQITKTSRDPQPSKKN